MDTAELIDVYREAERLVDQADALADYGEHERAGRTYSRAYGLVSDALDAVLAERETADAR